MDESTVQAQGGDDRPAVDVVVVGGGAAGLSAALHLGRVRRSVVVVDGGEPRNAPAAHMHGYLGLEGTSPTELLRAGRAETTRARNRVLFSEGILARVLPAGGKAGATLTARDAVYDDLAHALSLSGNIVCSLPDLRIDTEQASWSAGSNVILCPSTVRASSSRGEVDGEQLTVDMRTKEFSLRNVRARFFVDETGKLPL